MFGFVRRLAGAAATLVSREVMVLTNAIAFNFLLCLFPLLLVIVAAAQQLEGRDPRTVVALGVLIHELIPFGRDAFTESLRDLSKIAKSVQALSVAMILWGSSGIFIPMEMVLNRAWGGRVHRDFWKSRVLAVVMTLVCGTLVLGSIGLTVGAHLYLRSLPFLARSAAKATAFLLTFMMFFVIYRVIPLAPVRIRVAAKAALCGSVVWEAVKYLFVVKLQQMNLPVLYGPLALSVSIVLWAYVSSLVLVFGALMVPVEQAAAVRKKRRKE